MKLAILSDTHGLLRPEVGGASENRRRHSPRRGHQQARHCGAAGAVRAPLRCPGQQRQGVAEQIPHDRTVTLGGVTFYMVHNKKEVPADLTGVDAVVFGHSHKYLLEEKDGLLWLNPGSCGPRRFHQEITMMMAEAEDGKLQVEKIVIPHEAT